MDMDSVNDQPPSSPPPPPPQERLDEVGDCDGKLAHHPPSTPPPIPSEANASTAPIAAQSDSQCPFAELHHQNPNLREFLSLRKKTATCATTPTPTGDKGCGDRGSGSDEKLLLAVTPEEEEEDLGAVNCKIDHTISFLINNLQDCGGIWPLMFVEKLDRIVVKGDVRLLRGCFWDKDFALLNKLVDLFCEEVRCSLLFRYWCLFYNLLNRQIVPYANLAVSRKFLEKLRRDFLLAADDTCSCGFNRNPEDAISTSSKDSQGTTCDRKEREHLRMTPIICMAIASFLLIPLYSELATLEEVTQVLDPLTEKSFMEKVFGVISDHQSPHVFSGARAEGWEYTNKHILTHVVLAANLCFGFGGDENGYGFNPVVQVVSDLHNNVDHDLSQFRSQLLTVFMQETNLLQQGHCGGAASLLPQAPLGLQLAGVNGPAKMLIDILHSPSLDLFTLHDLTFIAQLATSILQLMADKENPCDEDEDIKINCLDLLAMTQTRITSQIEQNAQDSAVAAISAEIAPIPGSSPSPTASATSTPPRSHRRARPSLEEAGKPGRGRKSKAMLWPLEAILKLFGCSKRTSTISPEVLDIEYLQLR